MLLLLACTSVEDSSSNDSPADSAVESDLRTPDTCEASVDAAAPEFYQRYFACSDITVNGGTVTLWTEDLPPYPTAYYPDDDPNHTAWDDRGGDYTQNPNRIAAQVVSIQIAAEPVAKGITIDESLVDLEMGTSTEEYPGGPVGVGLDSVSYYNAVAAPGDSILDEQWTFDEWAAHPDQRGSYHHHSASPGPLEILSLRGYADSLELYGMMCDGTVLLGCTELDGSDVDSTSLDAQAGHVGDVIDPDGTTWFAGRYHVHMCEDFGNYGLSPEIQYYEDCGTLPP